MAGVCNSLGRRPAAGLGWACLRHARTASELAQTLEFAGAAAAERPRARPVPRTARHPAPACGAGQGQSAALLPVRRRTRRPYLVRPFAVAQCVLAGVHAQRGGDFGHRPGVAVHFVPLHGALTETQGSHPGGVSRALSALPSRSVAARRLDGRLGAGTGCGRAAA